MIICIPALSHDDTNAEISDHFGSAPYYVVYDSAKKMRLSIQNPGSDHAHGKCRPVDILSEYCLDAVLCHGMGHRALSGLQAAGITVYKTDAVHVEEAIKAAIRGELQELDVNACCTEHNAHCG